MHYMTVKTCREKVIVLWFYHILKTLHLQQLKNKRYTKKGVPFLSKMVYKRVRGWTILGRSLRAWNFVCIPPGADQFYFFGGNENSNSPPHVFSSDVFKRRTSTRRGIFVFFSSDFEHLLSQIVSKLLVKTLSNTNLVALREKGSILAAMTRRRDDFWHDQDATDDRQLLRGQQQQQGTETFNLYWHSDLLLTFLRLWSLPQSPFPFLEKLFHEPTKSLRLTFFRRLSIMYDVLLSKRRKTTWRTKVRVRIVVQN